jgi:hypothetical protein
MVKVVINGKAKAYEVIDDVVDAGIDDIETLRIYMKTEVERKRKSSTIHWGTQCHLYSLVIIVL